MKKLILIVCIAPLTAVSQEKSKDTLSTVHKYLPEITVVGRNSRSDIQQLPEVVGTSIYAGKKNSLVILDNVQGNVVSNNMRQVVAKVPGIQIWESDGSAIQIGIAARGLSPNRSWEFNVRQNGYDIAADPYGYPEAYYNPPLQAVQRMEMVRGAGSLQYGPQFGGMVNYILKNGSDFEKPFQFESQQTIGSKALFSSYNAIGGETSKIHYYAFFDHRSGDGWRENSRFYTNAGFGTFTYRINGKWTLTAEIMRNNIRSQQPGGLTDAEAATDPQKSYRARNWFDITWTTMALISNYQISQNQRINMKAFAVLGDRNSVGYLKSILVPDSINPATGEYNNRTVDIDNYRNFGFEARYLGDYRLWGQNQSLSGGIRLYQGTTYRYRDGKGTTGSEYTTHLEDPVWPRDIDYRSYNVAAFAEQIFRFSEKFNVIPGIRYEYLLAKASGQNGFDAGGMPIYLQNEERGRGFLLAGVGTEYHLTPGTEFYGNITQAYRPLQFADLTAPPTTDVIDTDLEDARGYNIDFGYRGKLHDYLYFDLGVYYLKYNNRVGVITQQRPDGSFYNYRTNVGNSASRGIETVVEINPVKAFHQNPSWGSFSVFASYAYTHARYGDFKVVSKEGSELVEKNLKDKKVENAPEHIMRTGISFLLHALTATYQFSYVSAAYSDANNTEAPSANGQNGLIPSYTVSDLTLQYRISRIVTLKGGINNLFDENYFTRRSGGYPGPGVLPSDGRTYFFTFGLKL